MTAHWLLEEESEVLSQIARAPGLFCFLDFDGTLAPLAPKPAEATPLAGSSELLARLVQTDSVQVAIVSGRPITDLRQRLDVPGAFYIGLHGLEVRRPNGETQLLADVEPTRRVLAEIKREIERVLNQRRGILIEDKGLALACHYRLATASDAATARRVTEATVRKFRRWGKSFMIVYGHKVAEIRMAGVDKGTAVRALLATRRRDCLSVYIGDDRTDEDAFAVLPPESITVHVGALGAVTRARYRVAAPAGVLRFLHAIVEHRPRGAFLH